MSSLATDLTVYAEIFFQVQEQQLNDCSDYKAATEKHILQHLEISDGIPAANNCVPGATLLHSKIHAATES